VYPPERTPSLDPKIRSLRILTVNFPLNSNVGEYYNFNENMAGYMRKSMVTYLVILFLSVVYIYFDGGFLPYTLFYIVLVTPVVSFIYLLIIYTSLRYNEHIGKREYQKGEILDYSLEIHNRSPFYIAYLTVFMHLEGQMLIRNMKTEHLSLRPYDRQRFHFKVPALYRGKYNIGISKIVIRDFLNLVSVHFVPVETKHIRVYPRILPLEELTIPYIRISENENLSQNKIRGSNDIRDIRDYMYGDSLKKIHWKLSSKHNKLLTKETIASSEKEFFILLNLEKLMGAPEEVLKAEDRTMEILVSMARIFLSNGIALKVCSFRSEQIFLTFSDIHSFSEFYDLFALIPFDRTTPFNDELEYFTDSMRDMQSVLIFSPFISEDHLNSLKKMNARGHDVSLFYCKAADGASRANLERVLEGELPDQGIKVVNIYNNMKDYYGRVITETVSQEL